MMKRVFAILAAGTLPAAPAATVLLDFEDDVQRASMPSVSTAEMMSGCVASNAVGGAWSFCFRPKHWQIGFPEWPSVDVPVAVSDWRRYDRLSIDVINGGPSSGDELRLYVCNPGKRPQDGLRSTLALTSGGYERWIVSLSNWPKSCDPANVDRIHLFFFRPDGSEVYVDNITLYAKGESIPPPLPKFAEMKAEAVRKLKVRTERQQRLRHAQAYEAFKGRCEEMGQSAASCLLGEATSMEKVLPRGAKAPRALDIRAGLSVRLSRSEKESVQLFVAPRSGDLSGVRVQPSDLLREGGSERLSATNVVCRVLGYVQTFRPPPYKTVVNVATKAAPGYVTSTEVPEVGWWPDPILEHLDSVDVKGTDIQGFWIRVSCPADQRAGIYRGTLRVSFNASERIEFPLTVRVNGFAVPRRSPLPVAVTFNPWPLRDDPQSPDSLWRRRLLEWGEFLADYYITLDNLYHRGNGTDVFPNFRVLRMLKAQGRLGLFNLGYWPIPKSLSDEDKEQWRNWHLGRLRNCYERARAEGLLGSAYLYGVDESYPDTFPRVSWAAAELRREFPGVPLVTTAFDPSLGASAALSGIDWFIPSTERFDVKKADASRKAGHRVWWYICSNPHAPYANMFLECTAIEGRLLMGAQTAKFRPDGFLYYQTAKWLSKRPIAGSCSFTDWTAQTWQDYNGDGCWTGCGMGGRPLPTVRLENFRDGLEDYSYVLELERRLAARPQAPWADEAKRLIAVPDEVTSALNNFTDDPSVVYGWRNRLADLIEHDAAMSGD